MTITTAPSFLRAHDVLKLVPISRATLYRWMKEGHFPQRRLLTPSGSTVAWLASDIAEWMASKPATNDGTFDGTFIEHACEVA